MQSGIYSRDLLSRDDTTVGVVPHCFHKADETYNRVGCVIQEVGFASFFHVLGDTLALLKCSLLGAENIMLASESAESFLHLHL